MGNNKNAHIFVQKTLHRPERKIRHNVVMIYIFYNYVSSNYLDVPL
jgi:hypothetical protein